MAEPAINLLIETMNSQPTILSEGGQEWNFRRPSNSLRGAALHLVEHLVTEVRRQGKTVQRQVDAPASTVVGPTIAAAPVLGPESAQGNVVFAVTLAGTAGQAEKRAAETAAWEWEIGLENLPPRLWLDERFLDLTKTAQDFRDRIVFGPVDFFRPLARLRDVIHIWQHLRTVQVGDISSGRFPVRTSGGDLRQIRWAQRCVETDAGPRVRGVCWDVTAVTDSMDVHIDQVEMMLSDKLLHLQDAYAAVGDITHLNAPVIVKWLTPYIPTIGHGVSTGQTPAIHPDTLAKIPGWLEAIKKGPVTDVGMTRRGGGGWLQVVFHADLLDAAAFPNLGIIIVYPGDVSVVAADLGAAEQQP